MPNDLIFEKDETKLMTASTENDYDDNNYGNTARWDSTLVVCKTKSRSFQREKFEWTEN